MNYASTMTTITFAPTPLSAWWALPLEADLKYKVKVTRCFLSEDQETFDVGVEALETSEDWDKGDTYSVDLADFLANHVPVKNDGSAIERYTHGA